MGVVLIRCPTIIKERQERAGPVGDFHMKWWGVRRSPMDGDAGCSEGYKELQSKYASIYTFPYRSQLRDLLICL